MHQWNDGDALLLVFAPSSSSSFPCRWQCVHALVQFHVCPEDSIESLWWWYLRSDRISFVRRRRCLKAKGTGGGKIGGEDRLHRSKPCVCSAPFFATSIWIEKDCGHEDNRLCRRYRYGLSVTPFSPPLFNLFPYLLRPLPLFTSSPSTNIKQVKNSLFLIIQNFEFWKIVIK